jgi:hypothetical protein
MRSNLRFCRLRRRYVHGAREHYRGFDRGKAFESTPNAKPSLWTLTFNPITDKGMRRVIPTGVGSMQRMVIVGRQVRLAEHLVGAEKAHPLTLS